MKDTVKSHIINEKHEEIKNTNFNNNKQKENKESETTNVFKYSNESAFNDYLFYD